MRPHSETQMLSEGKPAPGTPPEIKIGKATMVVEELGQAKGIEVFDMTLGAETIRLLPLRDWEQLDVYKWRVRGKLPGTPAGLEITSDHVRLLGETVAINDAQGCSKLEKLFNDWLALGKGTLDLARKKTHAQPTPAAQDASRQAEPQALHFRVEVDKRGQAHIHCLQGKETVASIGLNLPGFNSLISQGLMHKPRVLQTGALHDWVELDGVLCSFEKGNNDAAKLEKLLNGRYIPAVAFGQGKDVLIFANAASPTGFDIQFPVTVGGALDHHKRHLGDESLELLQDPNKCGLLPKGVIIKLSPPNLIFKQKTPDGGERYFEKGAAHAVTVTDDDGQETVIDLSQPVNFLRLSAVELTAVFNHPAINRHGRLPSQASGPTEGQKLPDIPKPLPQAQPSPLPPTPPPGKAESVCAEAQPPLPLSEAAKAVAPPPKTMPEPGGAPAIKAVGEVKPLPNLWLKAVLAQRPTRPDWFACLVYGKIAERFGNSREGKFGPSGCWAVALGEVEDIADPAFKGVFLTEKGSLGFLGQGQIARFHRGVAFLGTEASTIEGIEVNLAAVGLDAQQRIVFILTDNYRPKFGVPDQTINQELERLRKCGVVVMSITEALGSPEPLEVVWTVPLEQPDPSDPQPLESARPGNP